MALAHDEGLQFKNPRTHDPPKICIGDVPRRLACNLTFRWPNSSLPRGRSPQRKKERARAQFWQFLVKRSNKIPVNNNHGLSDREPRSWPIFKGNEPSPKSESCRRLKRAYGRSLIPPSTSQNRSGLAGSKL